MEGAGSWDGMCQSLVACGDGRHFGHVPGVLCFHGKVSQKLSGWCKSEWNVGGKNRGVEA